MSSCHGSASSSCSPWSPAAGPSSRNPRPNRNPDRPKTEALPEDALAEEDTESLPPAPFLDTLIPTAELAAELRLAADSAADEAVLEELAESAPADGVNGDVPTPDKAELANAVTWDIDVETFNDHSRVQWYLKFFQGRGRERLNIWLNRMPRYEPMIRERLQREGLPGDLVYLALIESGFSNTATSRAKAVGMWQFMKATGKHYGLRVDSWVDERRDPYKATDAAARHLRDLNDRFGSFYLAAAAYNAGSGRVSRGLRRLPDDDDGEGLASDATFFRLYDTKLLRRETKDYVPKLIAAAVIAKEPSRYGFTVTPAEPIPYDSIVVPTMTGLDVIARLADTTLAAVREMNPQYLRLTTPPGRASVVRIPAGRGPHDRRRIRRASGQSAGHLRRARRRSGRDDGGHRPALPGEPVHARRGESQGEADPPTSGPDADRAHRRRHLHVHGAPHGGADRAGRHEHLGLPPGAAG